MRVDRAPFTDVRVRQALRLATDRQALVDNVLEGFGRVGNDLPGPGAQFYLDTPRDRDLDQARSLLKQAGQQDLRVTLQTSPVVPGVVEAATLFSQQAKEAGITVNVKREDPSQYFDPSTLYLKMAFAQDYYLNVPTYKRYGPSRCFAAPRITRTRRTGTARRPISYTNRPTLLSAHLERLSTGVSFSLSSSTKVAILCGGIPTI